MVVNQHFPYQSMIHVVIINYFSYCLLAIPVASDAPWLTAMTGTGVVVLLVVILPLIVVLLILICRSYIQQFKKASENKLAIFLYIHLIHA